MRPCNVTPSHATESANIVRHTMSILQPHNNEVTACPVTASSKVRIGYVGCGFMAQKVHLPNFLSIPECEVVALAEVRPELGKTVQARLGIPELYADHQAMLADADIDAVAVSAAYAVQGDIACDALAAGKDVFMEKPMAISLDQADAILEAERQSGKRLMIGYMKRYDAGNELVKSTLNEFAATGEVGRLTYARNHGFCGDWISGLDTHMDTSEEPDPRRCAQGTGVAAGGISAPVSGLSRSSTPTT